MTKDSSPLSYSDINWQELYHNARKQKGWKNKTAEEWDKKAASFSAGNKNSEYSKKLINNLPLQKDFTLLDIGSGPGTLSIPVAKKVSMVTALDYSAGMLKQLKQEAEMAKVDNIQTIQCSWEDDWQNLNIKPHDITLASRSLNIQDLRKGLCKLNNFATKYVFLTDRINPTPFDNKAFEAVGRPFLPGPDYIFTVNMLYSMNIHPNITVLEFDKIKKFADYETAVQSYNWMFHDLSNDEESRLRHYVDTLITENNKIGVTIRQPHAARWALIWWRKTKVL